MAADGGGGCKTSRVGWLCLARYAVALVVSALAAVIFVRAVFLILHPNKFQLQISGNVLVERMSPKKFVCRFYLQAENRRERAFVYYKNVTVRLIDGHAPPKTQATIMEFGLSAAITLSQGQVQDYYFSEEYDFTLDYRYVQALFSKESPAEKQSIGDSTMELDGVITQDTEGRIGGDTYRATYSCAPITVVSSANNNTLLSSASGKDAARCVPTSFV